MNYSDGGNLLAAGNFNLINLYNSYTFEKLAVFNGHSSPLKELLWSTNDTILISSCHQGMIHFKSIFNLIIVRFIKYMAS